MKQGQGNCIVCGRITSHQCAECNENVCGEHLAGDGMCDECAGDWEDES